MVLCILIVPNIIYTIYIYYIIYTSVVMFMSRKYINKNIFYKLINRYMHIHTLRVIFKFCDEWYQSIIFISKNDIDFVFLSL